MLDQIQSSLQNLRLLIGHCILKLKVDVSGGIYFSIFRFKLAKVLPPLQFFYRPFASNSSVVTFNGFFGFGFNDVFLCNRFFNFTFVQSFFSNAYNFCVFIVDASPLDEPPSPERSQPPVPTSADK